MYAYGRKEPQRAVEGEEAQPLRIHPSRSNKERAGSQDNVPPRDIVNVDRQSRNAENVAWGIQLNFKNKRSGHGGDGRGGSQESNVEKINSDEKGRE